MIIRIHYNAFILRKKDFDSNSLKIHYLVDSIVQHRPACQPFLFSSLLLPLPSILHTLGNAVQASLQARANIAHRISHRPASIASNAAHGATQAASCCTGDSADSAAQTADRVAEDAGGELRGAGGLVGHVASVASVGLFVPVHCLFCWMLFDLVYVVVCIYEGSCLKVESYDIKFVVYSWDKMSRK